MTRQEFTAALARLASSYKLGIKEAALLFLAADGASPKDLAQLAAISLPTVNSRVQVLRAKRLVVRKFDADGTRRICPTKAGLELIKRTLNSAQP